jgi:hypothetical protein
MNVENEKNIESLSIQSEYDKCMNSPYYFATRYIVIHTNEGNIPFTTHLTEEEFNKQFNQNR